MAGSVKSSAIGIVCVGNLSHLRNHQHSSGDAHRQVPVKTVIPFVAEVVH
jgi:hypothetical protein